MGEVFSGHGKRAALAALLVALAAFLAFAPTLGAAFLWDDEVVQAEQAPALDLKSAITSRPAVANLPAHFYRPVVLLSYLAEEKLNRAIFGDPDKIQGGRLAPIYARLPHAVTMLIHSLASALLFFLALRLFSSGAGGSGALGGAFIAGLFFALHPAHSESVIMISGRSDSLAAVFMFAALLAALHGRGKDSLALPALSGVLFLFSLCAKEAAIAGLALLPIVFYADGAAVSGGKSGALSPRGLVPFAVAGAVYGVLRLALAGATLGVPRNFGPLEAGWRLSAAFAWYVTNLFFPWPVTPFAPDLPGVLTVVAMFALFAAGVWLVFRADRKGSHLPLFALALFILPLAPAMTVAVREFADAPVAQRYLYLPSAGLAIILGYIFVICNKRRVMVAVFAALLLGSASLCFATSLAWRTNRGLWSDLLKNEGVAGHSLPWLNLAQTYMLPDTLGEAERCYLKALNPGHPPDAEDRALAWNGLGGVYFNRAQLAFSSGRVGEALLLLARAEEGYGKAIGERIEGYPVFFINRAEARLQLAFLSRGQTGRWDGALLFRAGQDLEVAARMLPGDPHVGMLMARLRSYRGG